MSQPARRPSCRTSSRPPSRRPLSRVAGTLVLGLASLALLSGAPLHAEGGPGGPPPGQPPAAPPAAPQPPAFAGPNFDEGNRLFDEAIRYVARGQSSIPEVRDFFASLQLKLELPEQRQEGAMRVWFASPAQYRQELTAAGGTTTKILNGEQAWVIDPNGRISRLHGTADGARAILQLQEDRTRLSDLTQFLTLKGLKGPGIGFEFVGPTQGNGTYAGNWLKVIRRAPGRPDITFWLAYAKDAQGVNRAQWPGIVRVAGEPQKGYATEDYVLREWDGPQAQAREFRYPTKIEAYTIEPGQPGKRFLYALLQDIKVNGGVDATRFAPPQVGPAPAPPR